MQADFAQCELCSTLEYPFVCVTRGAKRVLEYARLAMGFANVRASRYGICSCSGGYSSTNAGAGAGGMARAQLERMLRTHIREAANPVDALCIKFEQVRDSDPHHRPRG